jgi:hypothetical protein
MLDPARHTSVAWTYFLRGDYESAIRLDAVPPAYCALQSRLLTGRISADALRKEEAIGALGARLIGAYRALFEGQVDEAMTLLEGLRMAGFADPEGWYLYGFWTARAGAAEPALELVTRSVDGGYACHEALTTRPEWDLVRSDTRFATLVERTATMVANARARFDALDGGNVLSPKAPPSSKG